MNHHAVGRLFRRLGQAVTPPPLISIAEWAERSRMVADASGSPHAGQWQNIRTPYLTEIMECLSFDHPSRSITFVKSHQVGGTEVGVNLIGYVIELNPCPVLVVMATLEEGQKYSQVKLQPTIEASPPLCHRVRDQRSRSEQGSTTSRKVFPGGYIQVTGANSSKGLKMISVRVIVCDEISDWPADVDNQGDPLSMAEKRTTAYSHNCKKFFNSTPALKGACRVTEKYEASDQRRYYVPCPQCDAYQYLTWDQMKWESERWPHQAYMACRSCGCPIEAWQRNEMVDRGIWIKTYDDGDPDNPAPGQVIPAEKIQVWRERPAAGRSPGFHIWQAYSKFVDWDDTVAVYLDAKGKQAKEKDFVQQVLGEAYDEPSDAPDYELLMKAREPFTFRQVPEGALVLTGFVDVQGNRLEYGVYAWGPGLSGWHIDQGIIEGDPEEEDVWRELDDVISRKYSSPQGYEFEVEAWGVDSGYVSQAVYRYSRRRPRVFACDGRDGWMKPFVGTPSKVDVDWRGKKLRGGAMIYPTGTFQLKSFVYAGLRKLLKGPGEEGFFEPGTLHFSEHCDQEFFEQLTAEAVVASTNNRGYTVKVWKKRKNRANEQLDIAAGARAMAFQLGLDFFSEDAWKKVAAERGGPSHAQGDLLKPKIVPEAEKAKPSPLDQLAARSKSH